MLKNRNMLITVGITSLLFLFVLFLVYLIYCYAYYDENLKNVYALEFNNGNYKSVYDNLENDKELSYDKFKEPLSLMYDKDNLKNIYYLYYSDLYDNLDDFIDIYYYGDNQINSDDIIFGEVGVTNLFHRKELVYKEINVVNDEGYSSSLGVKENVSFKIEDNGLLYVDDELCSCNNGICEYSYIFGGLHIIKYISNSIVYYGIVNVNDSNQVIDITMLDSLVKISSNGTKEVSLEVEESSYKIDVGTYKVSACYLDSGCPSKKDSYLNLNEDGTAKMYIYISLDISGDTYEGTYEIDGNFLILSFSGHVYKVHDYDTKQKTDIVGNTEIEMRFKIVDDNVFSNDSYKFVYDE